MPHPPGLRRAALALVGICIAQTFAMSLWFATTPLIVQIRFALDLSPAEATWMTMSVQAGFILGALGMSMSGIADALSSRVLFASGAGLGALMTLILVALPAGSGITAIGLRLITGVALAAVYSAGLKAMAGWFQRRRGAAMGALVGALVLGTALPHLFAELSQHWQATLTTAAVLSLLGAAIMVLLVPAGPYDPPSQAFSTAHVRALLRNKDYLLTVGGYLGHMWELYAFWAWVGLYLGAVAASNGLPIAWAVVATFVVIAVGALGAVLAGAFADRFGRERVIILSLCVSGACALLSSAVFGAPVWLVVVVLAVWGFFIVADSAQLSALATEVTRPEDRGTALSLQLALGFAITMLTIAGSERIASAVGWSQGFVWLAIGPVIAIACMLVLRSRRAASVRSALS